MPLDTEDKIMWAPQPTEATNPITLATSKAWKLGRMIVPYKIPMPSYEFRQTFLGQRDPNTQHVHRTRYQTVVAFNPTNLCPWVMFLGNCSTVANISTIQGIDTGLLPRIAIRNENLGGYGRYHTILDNVAVAIAWSIIDEQGVFKSNIALTFQGLSIDTTTLQSQHDGPMLPTDDGLMNGTEQDRVYRKAYGNFAVTFDQGGDNDDYTDEIASIVLNGANMHQIEDVQGQDDPNAIYEGNRRMSVALKFKRGADSAFIDEFLQKSQKDLRVYIRSSSTPHYLQADFTGCAWGTAESMGIVHEEQEPMWDAFSTIKGLDIEGRDGVHTDLKDSL